MNRKKGSLLAAGIGCVLILSIGAGVLSGWIRLPGKVQEQLDLRREADAVEGAIREEARGKKSFRIVLNQEPRMKEGERECPLSYENPEGNEYEARVSLYDKDGELMGHTGVISPGQQVEKIKLSQKQKAGEWPVTVQIDLFEKEESAGKLTVGIVLYVEEGGKTEIEE
ncbi:hypothetical protein [Anaerolentibacter hominis]|uniref:hypothetical protein n=1 Tax=Anaerolentibacter hominis TaxID=3079009 RepID=UPI0031B8798B